MNSLVLSSDRVSAPSVNVNGRDIRFATNKAGTGLVLMSKKDMGRALGLKGAALGRAHYEYRLEAGRSLNAGLAARMASGDVLAQKIVPTKHGFSVGFVRPETLKAPAPAKRAEIEQAKAEVTDKAIAALLAAGLTREQAEAALS